MAVSMDICRVGLSLSNFEEDGPTFGSVLLLRKTLAGFVPKTRAALEDEMARVFGRRLDCSALARGLELVSHSLNQGDAAKAAIASQFLDVPRPLADEDAGRDTASRDLASRDLASRDLASRDLAGRDLASRDLAKASVDDPEHPGWPARSPDREGGQFRPKSDAGLLTFETKSQRVARLRQRRSFRAILGRVLTTKRAVRIGAEWAADLIPGLEAAAGAASIADDVKLLEDIAEEVTGSQAALDFAEQGPRDLEDLMVSQDEASFSSYAAFLKLDLDKRFEAAGDGYQYHHLVEQGTNSASFSQEILQSTSNIVKMTVLHEDINALYATKFEFTSGYMPLREFLRGASFEQQRAWGRWALQQVGALK